MYDYKYLINDVFRDENKTEKYFEDLKLAIENQLENLMENEIKKPKKKQISNNSIIIKKAFCGIFSIDKCVSFENLYNEIPSRSLILVNIPISTTEEDIKGILIQFGDYYSCNFDQLNNGKITVKFYNILDAMMMRASTITINSRKIMMYFGKDEVVTDKKHPPNNGTIVVFNLPENASDNEIRNIFQSFGQIKDIRKTPNKNTQRFIEFYDTRSSRKAKNIMKKKKIVIAGKDCHINIEYSLPGNYRSNYEKYYNHSIPTIQRPVISKKNWNAKEKKI